LLISLATEYTSKAIGTNAAVPVALTDGFRLAYLLGAALVAAAAVVAFFTLQKPPAASGSFVRRMPIALAVTVAIAAFVGLAGTTTIGDYVRIGGQSAFPGHTTIGSRVTIGGGSHVWGDVPDGAFVSGQPAQDHRGWVRLQAYIRRLPKLFARVDALEKSGGLKS